MMKRHLSLLLAFLLLFTALLAAGCDSSKGSVSESNVSESASAGQSDAVSEESFYVSGVLSDVTGESFAPSEDASEDASDPSAESSEEFSDASDESEEALDTSDESQELSEDVSDESEVPDDTSEEPDDTSDDTSSDTSEEPKPSFTDIAVSLGKPYTVSVKAAEQYDDAYDSELTNGVSSGIHSYSNSELTGFATGQLEIVIDLGKVYSGIHTISASYYLDNNAGISSSLSFEAAYSSDRSKWVSAGKLTQTAESVMGSLNTAERKLAQEVSARYVRFTVRGVAAWIFLEELTVTAVGQAEETLDYGKAVEDTYRQLGTLKPIGGDGEIETELPKICISKGASYTVSGAISKKYPDAGGKMLTDGAVQSLYEHGCWVGFEGGKDVTVKIDLAEYAADIASVEIVSLAKEALGIYHPAAFDLTAIDDRGNKTVLGRLYAGTKTVDGQKAFVFSVGKTFGARYLEITMHTVEGALHFVGEIAVYAHRKETVNNLYPPVSIEQGGTPWESQTETYTNLVAGKTCQIALVGNVSLDNYENNTPITSPLLTDGVFSTDYNIHNGKFHKFCQGDMRYVVFDLEHVSAVDKLTIGFCDIKSWGVNAPPSVGVIVSNDGAHWYHVGELEITATEHENIRRGELVLQKSVQARYVAFSVSTVIWVGVDEIQVFGTKSIKNADTPDKYTEVYADTAADKRKEPSEDLLGGAKHLCLMYHSKDVPSYTAETLLPYLAYLDENMQIKDTMFDSFLFLHSTGAMPSGGSPYGDSVKSDWEWAIEDLFKKDANLDALDKTAGLVKEALGLPADFCYNVTLTIYDSNATMTDFGDVDGDGVSEDFSNYEDRIKAFKWYIDKLEARFAAQGYKNIRLVGYYWWDEAIDQNEKDIKKLLNELSDYIHSKDKDFFWIPYHCASGFSAWEYYGFDIACMQPNYVFKSETPYSNLTDNEKYTRLYGMGVEMEIHEPSLSDKAFFKKYMEYVALGAESGYMTDTVNMYYQSFDVFKTAAYSAEQMARTVYDVTYHYIKGDLKNVPDTLAPYRFEVKKNEIYEGDLGLDGQTMREFKISVLPEHGTVVFYDDGTFCYFPEKGYVGEVKFTFVYNEYLSWSEECEIVLNIK